MTTVCQHVCAHLGACRCRTPVAKECVLELSFAAGHFFVRHTKRQQVDAELQLADTVLHCHFIACGIPAEDASVFVERLECLKLIRTTDLHLVRNLVDDPM